MLTPLPDLIARARAGLRCLDAPSALREIRESDNTFIDVREPAEREASPVAGSVNIPRGVLEMKVTDIVPHADHPVYVHCATGGRARLSAEQLQRIGYTRVTAISCAFGKVREAFTDE